MSRRAAAARRTLARPSFFRLQKELGLPRACTVCKGEAQFAVERVVWGIVRHVWYCVTCFGDGSESLPPPPPEPFARPEPKKIKRTGVRAW